MTFIPYYSIDKLKSVTKFKENNYKQCDNS